MPVIICQALPLRCQVCVMRAGFDRSLISPVLGSRQMFQNRQRGRKLVLVRLSGQVLKLGIVEEAAQVGIACGPFGVSVARRESLT